MYHHFNPSGDDGGEENESNPPSDDGEGDNGSNPSSDGGEGDNGSNPSSDGGDEDNESNDSENIITRERLQALLDIAEDMLPNVCLKKRKHFQRRLINWKYNIGE